MTQKSDPKKWPKKAHLLIIQSCKDFSTNLGLDLSQNTSSLQGFHQCLGGKSRRKTGRNRSVVVLSQDRSKTPNFKKRGEGQGSFQALRIPGNLKRSWGRKEITDNPICCRFNYIQGNISSGRERILSLKLTVRPENRPDLKMKGSSSNHPFSGAILVSGRVNCLLCFSGLLQLIQWGGHLGVWRIVLWGSTWRGVVLATPNSKGQKLKEDCRLNLGHTLRKMTCLRSLSAEALTLLIFQC